MHNTVSYKGRDEREAVRDLVWWFGYRKTRMLQRTVKKGYPWMYFNAACGLGGCSGFPVIAAYERWAKRKLTDKDWEDKS